MTARDNYQRKMAHTFAEDVKRSEFLSKLSMDKVLMGNATSDERVANKRRARIAGEQAQVLPCHVVIVLISPFICLFVGA
jgi:hypothetical protein